MPSASKPVHILRAPILTKNIFLTARNPDLLNRGIPQGIEAISMSISPQAMTQNTRYGIQSMNIASPKHKELRAPYDQTNVVQVRRRCFLISRISLP